MINLYNSIAKELEKIEVIKHIDLDDNTDIGLYPAVYVSLGTLDYPDDDNTEAPAVLPFTLRILAKPFHQSGKGSPVRDELAESLSFIQDIKTALFTNETELIHNLIIKSEHLKKEKELFTTTLSFTGTVYSE